MNYHDCTRRRLLAAAVEANVRWSVRKLAGLPGAKQPVRDGRVTLGGAIYELDTGEVQFLKA